MRLEHSELLTRKRELHEVAQKASPQGFAPTKDVIAKVAPYIVRTLRDHIFKENTILYPTAFRAIGDLTEWEAIKAKCDEIGYCCFTPAF